MASESISVPILTPGANDAARNIKQVGDAAAGTGAKLDFAAGSLKLFNDAIAKSAKADATSVNALKAHAKATALLSDAENVLAGKATTTTRLFADQGRTLDDTGKKAGTAASGFGALAGTGGLAGGGMAAAFGVGALLSPVLIAVGTGVGGLALAAYGASKNTKLLAQELAPLKADVASFQKQLQPVVVSDFAKAIGLAGTVLHGIEPVAAATGKALSGALGQIGAEFQSQTWQNFFAFLARTAGPDVQLLTGDVVGLLKVLPPLIQDLQPLAQEALRDAGGVLQLADALEKAAHSLGDFGQSIDQRLSSGTGVSGVKSFGDAIGGLVTETGKLVPALRGILPAAGDAKGAAEGMLLLGRNSGAAAAGIGKVVTPAQSAANELQAMATATKNLETAQQNALNAQTAYGGDLVTTAGDAASLTKALKASHDMIGLHTAIQRASFSTANTYITDLGNTAKAAYDSGHGVDASIKAIRGGLPILDSAKTKNRQYWQEVSTLVGWLDKLKQIKAISIAEKVFGSGNWTVTGAPHGVPGVGGKLPFAAGGVVPGMGGGDTVPAMLTPGEAVVPRHLVGAVSPFLRANKVPGFASGGIAGSYSGSTAGLVPWNRQNLAATLLAGEAAVARATAAGIRAAAQTFAGGLGKASLRQIENWWIGAGGPGGGTAHVAAAITGAESGFNVKAVQQGQPYATTGWGLWQITPGDSEPQAGINGQLLTGPSNALAAVAKYRGAGGFSPWTTFEDGAYLQFMDKGGWLRRGLNVVMNNTGGPERVLGPGQGGNTYHVTVNVPPGTNKADAGRAFVECIREFERRSGNSWRS